MRYYDVSGESASSSIVHGITTGCTNSSGFFVTSGTCAKQWTNSNVANWNKGRSGQTYLEFDYKHQKVIRFMLLLKIVLIQVHRKIYTIPLSQRIINYGVIHAAFTSGFNDLVTKSGVKIYVRDVTSDGSGTVDPPDPGCDPATETCDIDHDMMAIINKYPLK
ncbi:MAG: hypothetical protein ACK5HS_01980 [Mycoplasmatales bacterium]